MALSPTQRTLAFMRQQGRICGMTEKFNPFVGPHGIRQDLFGFIDLIVLDPELGIIAIQSCGQSFAAHIRKITDSECTERVIAWLNCGGKVECWGWRKVKLKRGGKAMRWKPRIADFWIEGDELQWKERGK